jgi:putative ABC transport system ATP-binding protein
MKKKTIECKNIKKSFQNGVQRIEVLHDINLTAYEKEMIMLMGPSGSGKTTLISIIGGILEPDSGSCLVLDQDINNLPDEVKTKFRGQNIGFLFQHFILVPTINAVENAAIPLLVFGIDRNTAFQKASQLLEQMSLDEQQYKKPDQLSGGEQQRVAIARAFIHDPKIILCDEPTSFLDLERGKKIMEILQTMRDQNNGTIIVVTHDPRILSFADRIIYIEDGKIKEMDRSDAANYTNIDH